MTMTVQGMSSTISSSSASGKTSAQGSSPAGASFDATLTYQMSSAGGGSSTAASETTVKLEGLVQGLPAETNEAIEGLLEMLQSLLGELDKLDQALAEDPALLEELQSWLAQASMVLNGAGVQAQGSDGSAAMSPLAQHTDTVRFVIQDTLTQIKALISSAGKVSPGTETAVHQLVQSFHSLMGNSAGNVKQAAEHVKPSHQAANGSAPATEANAAATATAGRTQSTNAAPSAGPNAGLLPNAGQGGEVSAKAADSNGSGEPWMPEHGTVTAGQLALRSGTQVAVKPAAPPVPVERFANEMTSFIINKLEIVKQQGFTEARISLNPEHLGQVDIKLTMQNGQLIAQFMTAKADARELIDQQMAQLRTALVAQGLQVEKIEVTQSSQPSTANMYQDGRQSGSGQQQSQQRSKGKDTPSDDAVLAASLTEEWHDWISEMQADEGQAVQAGTFTAKA